MLVPQPALMARFVQRTDPDQLEERSALFARRDPVSNVCVAFQCPSLAENVYLSEM